MQTLESVQSAVSLDALVSEPVSGEHRLPKGSVGEIGLLPLDGRVFPLA